MDRLKRLLRGEQAALVLALLLLCVVLSALTPVFLSAANLKNVLRDASLIAIAGIGMVMVILAGEIDLSVGSVQAVVGILAVLLVNQTGSIFLALLGALVVGMLIGLLNGLLVTRARINSLIATLGSMAILRGGAMVGTQAVSIQSRSEISERETLGREPVIELPSWSASSISSIFSFSQEIDFDSWPCSALKSSEKAPDMAKANSS